MDVEQELDAFEAWLYTHKRVGKSTVRKYRQAIRKLLDEYGIERVIDFLREYTAEKRAVWVRYAVKAYLQYKGRYDLLTRLPPPRHQPRKRSPRYLPRSVLETIVSSIKDPKWRLAAWIQYLTGLRAKEVLLLRGKDIFPEEGGVRIRVVAKGGRERFVWIVRKDIADQLRRYAGMDTYLFHNPERSFSTTYWYYWRALKEAAENVLGDADFATHDFRRNFARDLLTAGVDILAVRKMLGHRRVDTTMRYVGEIAVDYRDLVRRVRG